VALKTDSFNGPIWSVSIEVMIYGVFLVITVPAKYNLWKSLCIIAISLLLVLPKLPGQEFALCLFYFYLGGTICQLLDRINIKRHNSNTNILTRSISAAIAGEWLG
jgi:peptidoglycan/LPS O-acetylase OafA/YrhL